MAAKGHVRKDSSSQGWETHGWGRGCKQDRWPGNFLSSAQPREELYQTRHCEVFSRKLRMCPKGVSSWGWDRHPEAWP